MPQVTELGYLNSCTRHSGQPCSQYKGWVSPLIQTEPHFPSHPKASSSVDIHLQKRGFLGCSEAHLDRAYQNVRQNEIWKRGGAGNFQRVHSAARYEALSLFRLRQILSPPKTKKNNMRQKSYFFFLLETSFKSSLFFFPLNENLLFFKKKKYKRKKYFFTFFFTKHFFKKNRKEKPATFL